ncbi:MAG: hypothetical protein ACK5S6_04015 [bacterium]
MKTVIEMAREAGLRVGPAGMGQTVWGSDEELERFAELVRADEREACAQFLESTQLGSLPEDTSLHYARLLKGFAEGIRARGNT